MNSIKHVSSITLFRFMAAFGFTCSFEFDDSYVEDISNADVEDERTNVNIVNTTNSDFLGFENASELSDMEEIDEDEGSPPEELDMELSLDLNKFCLTHLLIA